ncbi:MAG TPA: hypothetical protein VMS37_24070 [Verrucomicrobiae bacterium]|nr:hypothetical protein [Verrucomicrobiae bacterium]
MQLDDLAQVADDLRRQGVDACHEVLYGPHGGLEGLDVGEDFFPLWELLLPENQAALDRLDFAAIKARRGEDWSVEPPRLRRTAQSHYAPAPRPA